MNLNISYFKQKLEEEKKELEQELGNLGIVNPENNDWGAVLSKNDDGVDITLSADRLEDFETRSATLGELEIRYKTILRALRKIEDNSYGVCEICNEQIKIERLEANPSSVKCVKHMN